ncbi:MAG: hypothetical protein V4552_06740 [Pseudomonadota bacterium]
MAISNETYSEKSVLGDPSSRNYYNNSLNGNAVSWGAILAGAAAAAALSLILLLLGAGLGLSSVSPWAHKGVSASAFGISTIVWLSVTQILAAGMGGYLAGRLRTKWAGVQADEVYFRDTAHGFLAWAVASLATAALLTSAIGAIVSGGTQAAASLAGSAATATAVAGATTSEAGKSDNAIQSATDGLGYFIDSLFRPNLDITSASSNASQKAIPVSEVTRIFIHSMDAKTLPAADILHIGQLISKNTGLTQQEAEQRVNDIYSNLQKKKADVEIAAKEAAEKARKTSIYATLWLFVSLLMGAFSASLAATWGGRERDV